MQNDRMTINCKGRLVDLSYPRVMGILNITPDSFHDGGKHKGRDAILKHAARMLDEGASFLDIGAYSSRPGAADIPMVEEEERILPVIEWLMEAFPQSILSVDTFRSEVARKCLDRGAAMINDITAGAGDSSMMPLAAKYQVPYCMMHMKGTPQTMKKLAVYQDLISEVYFSLSEKVALARSFGISDLLIDPGFGFAKTISQNFELLRNLDFFRYFELPLLVGISRKSMIYKSLDTKVSESLNGTTALHMMALSKGAVILRVHDVAEAMECIVMFQRTSGVKA